MTGVVKVDQGATQGATTGPEASAGQSSAANLLFLAGLLPSTPFSQRNDLLKLVAAPPPNFPPPTQFDKLEALVVGSALVTTAKATAKAVEKAIFGDPQEERRKQEERQRQEQRQQQELQRRIAAINDQQAEVVAQLASRLSPPPSPGSSDAQRLFLGSRFQELEREEQRLRTQVA